MKREHSVRYMLWNHTRLARHVHSWFHTWDVLDVNRYSGVRLVGYNTILSVRQSLFQSMITNLNMINDKRGEGLLKVIDRADNNGLIHKDAIAHIENRILQNSTQLKKINVLRNNIVAHRSGRSSFRDILVAHPMSGDELLSCANLYHEISTYAYNCVGWFTNQSGEQVRPWELHQAARDDALEMLDRLCEPFPGP